MTLSKEQTTALTRKIHGLLTRDVKKEPEYIEASKDEVNRVWKIYKSLPKVIRRTNFYTTVTKDVIGRTMQKRRKVKKFHPTYEEIRNEIVFGTIDSETVTDLISKLCERFKIKKQIKI